MSDEKPLKEEAWKIEEYHNFVQDKLIAVASAILGFTAVMVGEGKLQSLRMCFIRLSWVCLGTYLLLAIGYMWAALRSKASNTIQQAFIRMDQAELETQPESDAKKEKSFLLMILQGRGTFVRQFRKKRDEPHVKIYQEFYDKYKDTLYAIRFLKNKDPFAYSLKDRLSGWLTSMADSSYLVFGAGVIFLIASVF